MNDRIRTLLSPLAVGSATVMQVFGPGPALAALAAAAASRNARPAHPSDRHTVRAPHRPAPDRHAPDRHEVAAADRHDVAATDRHATHPAGPDRAVSGAGPREELAQQRDESSRPLEERVGLPRQ